MQYELNRANIVSKYFHTNSILSNLRNTEKNVIYVTKCNGVCCRVSSV